MIRFTSASCGYDTVGSVLEGIDLTVSRGEFVGILGPNGSGKTTLLRSAMGVLRCTRGHVELDGEDVAGLSPRAVAHKTAFVPQRAFDGLDMHVRSLVLMGRYAHLNLLGAYSDQDREICRQAMVATDTLRFADRKAADLSGGELQRVLLARAIAQQAPLMLLDEPAASLDMGRAVETFDLLRQLHASGTTVVAVIHDMNLAALYCPRLVLLHKGRIHADGNAREILREDLLREVYHADITVYEHPATAVPQVLYLPRHAVDAADSAR